MTEKKQSLLARGVILETIELLSNHTSFGVTVVDRKFIVTSRDHIGNNYFDSYAFDGTHLRSVPQGVGGLGYRDLAFDGSRILASSNRYIDKIDPNDFSRSSRIYNEGHLPHRGLAYDPGENVIYSTDSNRGHTLKMDANTGETLREYDQPDHRHYGIAFDPYSQPGRGSLWFAAPWLDGFFRLVRVDTSIGYINYIYELSEQVADSAKSGGLEIINDHPDYPGKVVAIVIDQKNGRLHLVDIKDAPPVFPADISKVGEFGGWENGERITSGMVQAGDYLYAVDKHNQEIIVYDLASDPSSPSIRNTLALSDGDKIFHHRQRLFVTHGNDGFEPDAIDIYDLKQPEQPERVSTIETGAAIMDMAFKGNYAWLIQKEVKAVTVYDISDVENPQPLSTFALRSTGVNLEIQPQRNLLFAGCYNPWNASMAGVDIIDITEPENMRGLDEIGTWDEKPQRIQFIDDNYVALLRNDIFHNSTWLNIYDYSDSTDVQRQDQVFVSLDTVAQDMDILNGTICITIPGEGLKTYAWDPDIYDPQRYEPDHGMILSGPAYAFDKGLDFVHYEIPVDDNTMRLNHSLAKIIPDDDRFSFGCPGFLLFILRGLVVNGLVDGSETGFILRLIPGWPCGDVNLTMSVYPPEAASNGCITTPGVGVHSYKRDEQVNISASGNEENGWYFTSWSGDAGGTSPKQTLTMDRDKNVTANFDKIELSVSGSIGKQVYCPSKIKENTLLIELPFLACASNADGWSLNKISFRASGSGHDADDISSVEVFKGGSRVYSGKFSADNGTVDVVFSPEITIGAGQCVPFKLACNFHFEVSAYAIDRPRSFHIESFGVAAEPLTYEEGEIKGKAQNDSLVFARVFNNRGDHFTTINEAVNSKRTPEGGTCTVCQGEYHEAVRIDKSLTLQSKAGRGNTYIMGERGLHTLGISAKDVTVRGFSIRGKDTAAANTAAVFLNEADNALISDSYIDNMFLAGLYVTNTSGAVIRDNIIMNPSLCISFKNSVKNQILDNTFNGLPLTHTLYMESSHENLIRGNRGQAKFDVKAESSDHNIFEDNEKTDGATASDIELVNCEQTTISKNRLDEVVGLGNEHILIGSNTLESISLISASYVDIMRNTFIQGHRGISLSMGEQARIYENSIRNGNGGIEISDMKHVEIRINQIHNNDGQSGIDINRSEHIEITHLNRIHQNGLWGISVFGSSDVLVRDNYITSHTEEHEQLEHTGIGIYAYGKCQHIRIIGNVLLDNCTSIYTEDCKDLFFAFNRESDALCLFTGVHLSNTSGEIYGNEITRNNGAGILLENGSEPLIRANNITENETAGIENLDATVTIAAAGNWWGSANGPAAGDAIGNVDAATWLSLPADLLVRANADTFYIAAGECDSAFVSIINLNNPSDAFAISVTDQNSWISSPPSSMVAGDSTSVSLPLLFDVPGNADSAVMNRVVLSATSQALDETARDTFYVAPYEPSLAELVITPDSLEVLAGDTIYFSANGYDQFGNAVTISPLWSATEGSIDSGGRYIAPNRSGRVIVTVTAGEVQSSISLEISGVSAVVDEKPEKPDSFALLPNYPNPFNPVTVISYQLSSPARVDITVHDIRGRQVAVLAQGHLEIGFHKTIFDASGLAAGVYFIRLIAVAKSDYFETSQKILFLK
ncbi:T9SS type A sorting domain-containing protein [candidate division KSB1 bacterium]|nr:T9SS type A sorting domain-containing protein [candidate division KSB1 bacterium]